MGGCSPSVTRSTARPRLDWVEAAEAELESLADCRILRRTTVLGVYDGGTYAAIERVNDHVAVPPAHEPRQRLWRIVAKRAVLAAGAIERPHRVRRQRPARRHAGRRRARLRQSLRRRAGPRAVIFADNDDAFRTADDLAEAGVTVAALIDARKSASPRAQGGGGDGASRAISRAPRSSSVRGGHGVRGVVVGDASGKTERFACDLVAVSGGWNPTVHLTTHLNGKPQWSDALCGARPWHAAAGHERRRRGRRARSALAHAWPRAMTPALAAAAECGFTASGRAHAGRCRR